MRTRNVIRHPKHPEAQPVPTRGFEKKPCLSNTSRNRSDNRDSTDKHRECSGKPEPYFHGTSNGKPNRRGNVPNMVYML